jgi:glycosyltransferase involved in cell wall biosynthesis
MPAFPLAIGCPLVVTLYDLCWRAVPGSYRIGERLSQRWWLDRAVRRADRIIAVSQNTARDVTSLYPKCAAKMSVVHPALDERYFRAPDAGRLSSLREKLGIARPFILSVGTITPRKNLRRLTEAYAALREEHGVSLQLVLAGGPGWRYEGVENLRRSLGLEEDVIMAGYLNDDDLHSLYAAADMFAMVSLYEGFGIPVLEAMAVGTPVVASNTSSLPEVVGGAGVLVDPYDVQAISRAMWQVHSDKSSRQELIDKGRERARSFTWEGVARETSGVFSQAAAAARS